MTHIASYEACIVESPVLADNPAQAKTDCEVRLSFALASLHPSSRADVRSQLEAAVDSYLAEFDILLQSVYRLAESDPDIPAGGTTSENHIPADWTTIEPEPTTTESVYRVSRNVATSAGAFVTATVWGHLTRVKDNVTVPDRPENLAVSETTSTSLAWTWSQVEGAASYDVEWRQLGSTLVTKKSENASTFTLTELSSETSYEARVRSRNIAGTSDWTSYVSGETEPPPPLTWSFTLGKQYREVGQTINRAVPVPTGGAAPITYTESGLPGGISLNLSELASGRLRLSGTLTTPGATTTTLTATDALGSQATVSVEFDIGPDQDGPGPLGNVALSNVGHTGALLSWTAPTTGDPPLHYRVSVWKAGATPPRAHTYGFVTDLSWQMTGLDPGTDYVAGVWAQNYGGVSNPVRKSFSTLAYAAAITGPASAWEGATVTLESSDPPTYYGANPTYAWSVSGNGATVGATNGDSLKVQAAQVGAGGGLFTATLTVTSADANYTSSDTHAVTVNDVTPLTWSFTLGKQYREVGQTINRAVPVPTGGAAPITYTESGLPGGISLNLSELASGRLRLSGTLTTPGATTTTLTATDALGSQATVSVEFDIGPDQDGPGPLGNVALSNVGHTGALLSWTAPTTGDPPLHYRVSVWKAGATPPRAHTYGFVTDLSWQMTGLDPGTDYVAGVWAQNYGGVSNPVRKSFSTLAYAAAITGPASAWEGATVTLESSDPPTYYGANPTYAWSVSGNGATVGATNGDSLKVRAAQVGAGGGLFTATLTVTSADANYTSSDTHAVTVNDVTPLTWSFTLGKQYREVGQTINRAVPVPTGGTTPITYAASGLPGGISLNKSELTSGRLRLSGTLTTPGATTTTLTATDALGSQATVSVEFDIGPDQDGPGPLGNVALSNVGHTGALLSWTAPTTGDPPLHYRVSVWKAGATPPRAHTYGFVTDLSWQMTGLDPETDYVAGVWAQNYGGVSNPVRKSFSTLAYAAAITGAGSVSENATITLGSSDTPGYYGTNPAYAWSVSGDGTAVGATNGSSLRVRAATVGSNGGSFTATLTVTSANGRYSSSDTHVVTVDDTLDPASVTASLSSIGSVSEGGSGTVTATLGGKRDAIVSTDWTVTGAGASYVTLTKGVLTCSYSVGAVPGQRSFQINFSITVSGLGTNARNGTSASRTANASGTIVNNGVAPSKPTGVTASASGGNWSATTGSTPITYQWFLRRKDRVGGTTWGTTTGTSASFSGQTLTSNTEYVFGVRARNLFGTTSFTSKVFTAHPSGVAPSKPTGVTASAYGGSWNASTGTAPISYKWFLSRKDRVGGTLLTAWTTGTNASFSGFTLTPNTEYRFGVRARNLIGTTSFTSVVFTAPPTSSVSVTPVRMAVGAFGDEFGPVFRKGLSFDAVGIAEVASNDGFTAVRPKPVQRGANAAVAIEQAERLGSVQP